MKKFTILTLVLLYAFPGVSCFADSPLSPPNQEVSAAPDKKADETARPVKAVRKASKEDAAKARDDKAARDNVMNDSEHPLSSAQK